MRIYDSLPVGEKNGYTFEQLKKLHNIPCTRSLFKEIHDERKAGLPILNSNKKYYKPASTEEYQKCIDILTKKGLSNLLIARALVQAMPDQSKQITINQYLEKLEAEVKHGTV